ncbi:iron chelate uptake ABC transporter family permease subunit [Blastococcus sp. Marseille-P5729]|uniref:iron chelate uptake ABC transporter family permease subunit n=1 Tax=Blastococcus sp. Marseille-P5729 TaxID=2086582 RepID=UPI0018FEE986|nr:iron chelate uptake ABC transporter family permease subunit [Blastococcus sp. Marseille-P5729]
MVLEPLELSDARPAPSRSRDARRMTLLVAVAAVCIAVFLTIGVTGNWDFILPRRLTTVATMSVVAVAIAISTVLFHTITANRILTPSIMGFDSLYLLIQTAGVFVIGSSAMNNVDTLVRFALEALLMVGMSVVLYRWLLLDTRRSLHLLVLVGVIIGTMLRSLSSLLQRIMSPEEFIVVQDAFFADFTGAEPRLLAIGGVLILACVAIVWRLRRELDVLALGRDTSVGLGVDHRALTMRLLVLIAILVAVATALVGPTTFFGLLVAHLAYQFFSSQKHAVIVPAASLCALIALIGGQVVFERILGFQGSLSMVVEFLGGIVFIVLLLRRASA